MLGRTHRDWDGAAARFVEAGIAVLAVDFRQVAIGDPESADSTRNRYASSCSTRRRLAPTWPRD